MLTRATFLLLVFLLPALNSAAGPAPVLEFKLQWLAVYGRRESTLNYDFNGDGKLDILGVSINFDVNPPERWLSLHYQNKNGEYNESPDVMWPVSDNACALVIGDFLPAAAPRWASSPRTASTSTPGTRAPLETAGQADPRPHLLPHPALQQTPALAVEDGPVGRRLDDLIVPLPDGYRIYFQTAPASSGRSRRWSRTCRPRAEGDRA
jgi:hypothetical protein